MTTPSDKRPVAEANKTYEIDDHLFRSSDQYALAKYEMTFKWLLDCDVREGALLNVGCGAGLFNSMAAQRGFSVVGVEPERKTFDLALNAARDLDVQVIHGTLEDVPSDRRFDVIVMHDVLEHIDDEGGAIRKLASLMSENGVLVLSVPALPILFGKHDEDLGHYRRYTRATLVKSLSLGFEVKRVRYYGVLFIPVVYLLSVLFRRQYPVGAARGKIGSLIFWLMCRFDYSFEVLSGTSLMSLSRAVAKRQ